MSSEEEVLEVLYNMYIGGQKTMVQSAIRNAIQNFTEYLYAIAVDIYDSCIQSYYSQYTPSVYDRHGNITPLNLYSGKDFSFANGILEDNFNAGNLLKYPGKNGSKKRTHVLNAVLKGLRGGRGIPGFPMEWDARYPNEYSAYDSWTSSGGTLRKIFNDFDNNVISDLEYKFYDYLRNEIL